MTNPDETPKSRPVGTGTADGATVRDAPFPHVEPAREGRNADRVPRVPEGPQRGPAGPTTRSSRPEERRPAGDNR